MTLNYSTDRTPGWKVDETIQIPIVGPTVPPRLKGVAADDRRRRREDREALVRPELPDHRGDHLQGLSADHAQHQLPVPLGRQGRLRPHGPGPRDGDDPGHLRLRVQLLRRRQRRAGRRASASSARTRRSSTAATRAATAPGTMDTHFFCGVPVGQTITRAIGSWDARPTNGLGGWSLSDHHAYDPVERALHRGDGATIRAEALPPVVDKVAGTTNTGVGSGRGGANYPKDGDARHRGQHRLHGRLRPLARRQPLPAQRPQPQRHLPHQPRRQDLPVRRQRLQGPRR